MRLPVVGFYYAETSDMHCVRFLDSVRNVCVDGACLGNGACGGISLRAMYSRALRHVGCHCCGDGVEITLAISVGASAAVRKLRCEADMSLDGVSRSRLYFVDVFLRVADALYPLLLLISIV